MSVRVVARIRPLLSGTSPEQEADTIVRGLATDGGDGPLTMVSIPNPKNEAEEFSFGFNAVYGQEATQEDIFSGEVAPHVKHLFNGVDVAVFAYGATGTGKTHTMQGGLKLTDRGVIPRLLSGIFRRSRRLERESGGRTVVWLALSYYEIYNDRVLDLLAGSAAGGGGKTTDTSTGAGTGAGGLPLREDADGRTVVVGLTERACSGLRDFEQLYLAANARRATAATRLNARSSRSHAILRVRLTQETTTMAADGDGAAGGAAQRVAVRESTASAIDLAGSEDNRRTDNEGERLVESAAINKSLFVLGQCIDAMARADRRVPFRESKLTRILGLGQRRGITVMILNLAPVRAYHLDTLSSLNVSSRAKRIEVREIENEVVYKHLVPRSAVHPLPSITSATHPAAPPSTVPFGGLQRQPLRPLANAHNTKMGLGLGKTAASLTSATGKPPAPVKSFSVYADGRGRQATHPAQPRTSAPYKRAADAELATIAPPRPGKVHRSTPSTELPTALIEAMVERKVSELLMSRTPLVEGPRASTEPPAVTTETVQRRLDELERRIENRSDHDARDGVKTDGLHFLLLTKQYRRRDDDASALVMYEAALPFFPNKPKLVAKIGRLRSRLAAARHDHDPDYVHQGPRQESEEEGPDMGRVAAARAPRKPPRPAVPPFADEPRTRRLLQVVNSGDVEQIRGLCGFGAKRAADLAAHLASVDRVIGSLDQLRAAPGVGPRTVERALEGLCVP